jgi:hypothetical protein
MNDAWRCIPVPDAKRIIFDDNKDRKTDWIRAALKWGRA